MNRNFGAIVRSAVTAAAVALLSSCNGGDDPASAKAIRYQAAVEDVMNRYRFPGAVAGVWVPGEAPWRMAFGLADVPSKRAMTLEDSFSIRSVTKSFAVTVLMQLERDGLLSMNDPIAMYVPGIPNGERISLAQLAAMESGVANYSGSQEFFKVFLADFEHVFTPADLVAYGVALSPRFEPGAEYNYSNTNTVLLGMVVEKVAQAPLDQVLHARIFEPLKLSKTLYPYVVALPDPHPTPYGADGVTGELDDQPYISPTSLGASGAMVSTIDDLGTWGRALGSGSLLTPQQHALRMSHSRPATDGPAYETYGLGMGMIKGWWGHTGSGIGFQAATLYDPRTGATIAVLVNATPEASRFSREDNIAQDVFAALADIVNGR